MNILGIIDSSAKVDQKIAKAIAGLGSGGASIVDNGDGTLTSNSPSIVDNGDGTLTA